MNKLVSITLLVLLASACDLVGVTAKSNRSGIIPVFENSEEQQRTTEVNPVILDTATKWDIEMAIDWTWTDKDSFNSAFPTRVVIGSLDSFYDNGVGIIVNAYHNVGTRVICRINIGREGTNAFAINSVQIANMKEKIAMAQEVNCDGVLFYGITTLTTNFGTSDILSYVSELRTRAHNLEMAVGNESSTQFYFTLSKLDDFAYFKKTANELSPFDQRAVEDEFMHYYNEGKAVFGMLEIGMNQVNCSSFRGRSIYIKGCPLF